MVGGPNLIPRSTPKSLDPDRALQKWISIYYHQQSQTVNNSQLAKSFEDNWSQKLYAIPSFTLEVLDLYTQDI